MKINVDAGCFSHGNAGWGLVARKHYRSVMLAETKCEDIEVSSLVAETMGLRSCLL